MDFWFCGTKKDLEEVIRDVESRLDLRYYLLAFYASSKIPSLNTLIGPKLGNVTQVAETYYVLPRDVEIKTSFVGGINNKYKIDHQKNPKSIRINPGGILKDGHMVWGALGESSKDPDSIELFKVFKSAFKKRFCLVNFLYLGKEAETLFDEGWRITQFANSSFSLSRRPEELQRENDDAQAGKRLSYKSSCQYLMFEAGGLGCDRLIAVGWDGDSEPLHPLAIPLPSDECRGISFSHEFLGGADPEEEEMVMENLTLSRSFFCKNELNGVSFRGSDLSECFMCWNDVLNTDFTNADLASSDMRANSFKCVSFKGANLTNADLRFSSFEECDFSDARMLNCKIDNTNQSLLGLNAEQRDQIQWCSVNGPEPPGG